MTDRKRGQSGRLEVETKDETEGRTDGMQNVGETFEKNFGRTDRQTEGRT